MIAAETTMIRISTYRTSDARPHFTVVARTQRDLQQLQARVGRLPGKIHPLRVDYCDASALYHGLQEALRLHGPVRDAVCWIHSVAPDAPAAIAEALALSSPG